MRTLAVLILLVLVTGPATGAVLEIRGTPAVTTFTNFHDVPNDTTSSTIDYTFPSLIHSFEVPAFDNSLGVLNSTIANVFSDFFATTTHNVIGDEPLIGARAGSRVIGEYKLFKNGIEIDAGNDADGDAQGCFRNVCSAFAEVLFLVSHVDLNALPGDKFDVVMTLSYSAMFGSSEIGTFMDSVGIEASGRSFASYFYDFTPSPVPLPPAAWLFLSAIGLLVVRFRTAKRPER